MEWLVTTQTYFGSAPGFFLWMGVKSEIDKVLGINIIFTPSQFLFNLAPEGMYTRDQKQLLHILLMTEVMLSRNCCIVCTVFL